MVSINRASASAVASLRRLRLLLIVAFVGLSGEATFAQPPGRELQKFQLEKAIELQPTGTQFLDFKSGGFALYILDVSFPEKPAVDEPAFSFSFVVPADKRPLANVRFQPTEKNGNEGVKVLFTRSEVDKAADEQVLRTVEIPEEPIAGNWTIRYERGLISVAREERTCARAFVDVTADYLIGTLLAAHQKSIKIEPVKMAFITVPPAKTEEQQKAQREINAIRLRAAQAAQQRKYREANDLMADATMRLQKEVPNAHADLAIYLAEYLEYVSHLQRTEEIEQLGPTAVNIAQLHWGKYHPLTASVVSNYGEALRKCGKTETAEATIRDAITLREAVLGANPETAIAYDNLALLLGTKRDYVEAAKLHEQALPIFEAAWGESHPDTILCRDNLASALMEVGQWKRAGELSERNLELAKKAPNYPNSQLIELRKRVIFRRLQLGEGASAIEEAGRLRSEFRATPPENVSLALRVLTQFARSFYQYGFSDESQACLALAGELAPKFDDQQSPQAAAEIWLQLSEAAVRSEDWNKAAEYLAKAEPLLVEHFAEDDQHRLFAAAIAGRILLSQRKREEAAAKLKPVAFAMRDDETTSWDRKALAFQWYAELLQGQFEKDEAIVWFDLAIGQLRPRLGDLHPDVLRLYVGVAALLSELGRQADVRQRIQLFWPQFESLLATEPPEGVLGARLYDKIGDLYLGGGDVREAERQFAAAVNCLEKDPLATPDDWSRALLGLAKARLESGQLVAARSAAERALKLLEGQKEPDPARLWQTLHVLGYILQAQHDLNQAERVGRRTVELLQQHEDLPAQYLASALNSLGLALMNQHKNAEAEKRFIQAIECWRVLGNRLEHAIAINNLATLYQSLNKSLDARKYFEQALEVVNSTAGKESMFTANIMTNLGLIDIEQEDYDAAKRRFEQVLTLRRAQLGDSHPMVAQAISNLAAVAYRSGDLRAARTQFQQAYEMERDLCVRYLPGMSQAEGLKYAWKVTSSRNVLLRVMYELRESSSDADERNALTQEAFQIVCDSRQLVSRMQGIVQKGLMEQSRSGTGQLRSVQRNLAMTALNYQQNKNADYADMLRTLAEKKETLEREQGLKAATEYKDKRFDVASLADILPADTAIVEFIDGSCHLKGDEDPLWLSNYHAFTVRKRDDGKLAIAWIVFPADPIHDAADRWLADIHSGKGTLRGARPNLNTAPATPESSASYQVRDLLWKPISAELPDGGDVILVPDGALGLLPWGALPGGDAQKYLLEERAIVMARSSREAAEWLSVEPQVPTGTHLLIGGVDYARQSETPTPPIANAPVQYVKAARDRGISMKWDFLPGTLQEVQDIARIYQQADRAGSLQVLQGSNASEGQFRSLCGQAAVLHLATHGFYAPPSWTAETIEAEGGADSEMSLGEIARRNPLLWSGIALAGANAELKRDAAGGVIADDGILSAEDVLCLPLGETQLVILSACETGQGKVVQNEGVFGLHHAFQQAGARSVIATLWRIDDRASSVLMSEFYRHWLVEKKSKLAALRLAQLAVLDRYDVRTGKLASSQQTQRAAPQLWAGFHLYGDAR